MKHIFTISLALIVALSITLSSSAQTPPPPTPRPAATKLPRKTIAPRKPRVKVTATPKPTLDPNAPRPTTPPKLNPGIKIQVQKMGYENWGRPRFLDDPTPGDCGPFDNNRPLYKFGISLAIWNRTKAAWPTGTRSIQFFKSDGSEATWCFYDYLKGGDHPPTNVGEAYQFTYDVYVEHNERVSYFIFEVNDVGYARFDVPDNLPTP